MIGIEGMDLAALMGFTNNPVSEKCSNMNRINVSPISSFRFRWMLVFDRHLYL